MTLVKWKSPVTDPAVSIPSLIDNFFGRDMEELLGFGHGHTKNTMPAVNIRETNDHFNIEVAAPGMKKEDFMIEVENDSLTISSEVENNHEENDKEGRYTRKEFSYSAFKRSFTLPQTVDSEKINASYTDGMLTISIPKKEEAKEKPARRIDVK